jgi:hypothetical protein
MKKVLAVLMAAALVAGCSKQPNPAVKATESGGLVAKVIMPDGAVSVNTPEVHHHNENVTVIEGSYLVKSLCNLGVMVVFTAVSVFAIKFLGIDKLVGALTQIVNKLDDVANAAKAKRAE